MPWTVPGIKSHRVPFLASGGPGADSHASFRRQRGRVDERPPRLGIKAIDPLGFVGPGHFAKRLAVEELTVFTVQAIEIPVAVCLNQRLGGLAGNVDVDQQRFVDAVIIPEVVWAVLEMPFIGAIVWIEGENRAGVEVVSLANLSVEVGRRVADAPVKVLSSGSNVPVTHAEPPPVNQELPSQVARAFWACSDLSSAPGTVKNRQSRLPVLAS